MALVIGLLVSAAVTLVRAAVMAHLWQWFVADPFGAPRVGVATMAGLLLILMFVAHYFAPGDGDDKRDWTPRQIVERGLTHAGVAAFSLMFGLVLVAFR